MRTGAAGRIAIPSRPMCRISWRRRRPNSSGRMRPCPGQLVERKLGARADELDEFGKVALAGFAAAAWLELRARDVREIAQELADVAGRADRLLRRAGADAIQEAPAPGGQRRDAIGERRFLAGQ